MSLMDVAFFVVSLTSITGKKMFTSKDKISLMLGLVTVDAYRRPTKAPDTSRNALHLFLCLYKNYNLAAIHVRIIDIFQQSLQPKVYTQKHTKTLQKMFICIHQVVRATALSVLLREVNMCVRINHSLSYTDIIIL